MDGINFHIIAHAPRERDKAVANQLPDASPGIVIKQADRFNCAEERKKQQTGANRYQMRGQNHRNRTSQIRELSIAPGTLSADFLHVT